MLTRTPLQLGIAGLEFQQLVRELTDQAALFRDLHAGTHHVANGLPATQETSVQEPVTVKTEGEKKLASEVAATAQSEQPEKVAAGTAEADAARVAVDVMDTVDSRADKGAWIRTPAAFHHSASDGDLFSAHLPPSI